LTPDQSHRILEWMASAARTRLPHPKRLDLTLQDGGVRIMVTVYGARQVACTVPWEALARAATTPFPATIERCSLELDMRSAER